MFPLSESPVVDIAMISEAEADGVERRCFTIVCFLPNYVRVAICLRTHSALTCAILFRLENDCKVSDGCRIHAKLAAVLSGKNGHEKCDAMAIASCPFLSRRNTYMRGAKNLIFHICSWHFRFASAPNQRRRAQSFILSHGFLW